MPYFSHVFVARVTLEAETPLALNNGGEDGLFDTDLVRDANGLPLLPGTSIAGVLRHLYQQTQSCQQNQSQPVRQNPPSDQNQLSDQNQPPDPAHPLPTEKLFGYQTQDENQAQASRLSVSCGHVHDQQNRAGQSLNKILTPSKTRLDTNQLVLR